MDDSPLLAVAHRAGNNLADLRAALAAGVDLVEADVHLYRGALEVRHRKAVGPNYYWEQWTEVGRVLSAGDPLQLVRLRGRLRRQRAYGVSIRLSLLTPGVVAELRRATDRR
jgi:hypothetical protein